MKSWSRQIFLVIISVCFFSILYLTLMEKNSISGRNLNLWLKGQNGSFTKGPNLATSRPIQQIKQAMDQVIEVVKKHETTQKVHSATESPHDKEMHFLQNAASQNNMYDDDGVNRVDPNFLKNLENRISESLIQNITASMIDPALQALRLELLKELYGTTYDKLLESALQSKPISSRPRPRSMQIIIATTWRSGSTFLEELIESHPGMYNFYEPLLPFGIKNFYANSDPDAGKAQDLVTDLLKCKYTDEYIKVAKITSIELFARNQKLWHACKSKSAHNALCFQKKFLEAACKIFPWTLMKLVRIGVRLLKPVLEDEFLNVHVVYLVRDPRAVTHSRLTSVHWCDNPLCTDPSILCEHMEDDYKAVKDLAQIFPGRIHVIRYEDLALSPMNVTKNLLSELNLDFDPNMEKFINSHTTKNYEKPWSTSRESSKRVNHWVSKINDKVLTAVQKVCSNVMPNLGYKSIISTKNVSLGDILEPNFLVNL